MEVAFFDTSALVKHYHIERGSSIVNELMENYVVAVSELAILEMTSALNRRFLVVNSQNVSLNGFLNGSTLTSKTT